MASQSGAKLSHLTSKKKLIMLQNKAIKIIAGVNPLEEGEVDVVAKVYKKMIEK